MTDATIIPNTGSTAPAPAMPAADPGPAASPTSAAPAPQQQQEAPAIVSPQGLAPGVLSSVPHEDLFGGKVRPVDYQFEQAHIPEAERMPMSQMVEIRNVLAESGFPREVINQSATRWEAARKAGPQTDEQLQIGMRQCQATLERTYGPDRAAELISLARSEAARLMKRSPTIKAMLSESQLGNDPWLVSSLANAARARQAKQAK